jgi:AcrR family transcriptional regulator
MGRKGWGGSPPGDDDEARKRIVDAAVRSIEHRGADQTSLSDIADDLGITRRTVYRYFAGTEELFASAAVVALDGFVGRVETITAELDVTEQLIEVVAYIIENLPQEPSLTLLLANDKSNLFTRGPLTSENIARCRGILQRTHIDWAALGYDEHTIDEFVEFMLRIIQSMVVAPIEPARSGIELRAYLRRWLGPAVVRPR